MEAVAHKTCKGFSLIEAAIVLAVVGGVIGGIWYSAAAVYENHRVNKTVEGVQLIVKNIQGLISMVDSESIGNEVNITSTVINAGLCPKDWINENRVVNPFGGSVYFVNYPLGNPRFNFYLHSIPSSACIKIISRISGLEQHGTTVTYYQNLGLGYLLVRSPQYVTQTFPLTPEQATTFCEGGLKEILLTFGYTRIN